MPLLRKWHSLFSVGWGGAVKTPSNVVLVQSATANITGTSSTVQLLGVTSGNIIAIVFGARTPTGSAAHFPTLADSQLQTITTRQSIFVIGNAGAYALVASISAALSGTHTITISTTDTAQTGQITIYELSGVANSSGATASNASASGLNHIRLTNPFNVNTKNFLVAAAGFEVVAGTGASYVWSDDSGVTSLTADGSDPNFTGLCGHATTVQLFDCGATRQGTLSFFGQALAAVLFS